MMMQQQNEEGAEKVVGKKRALVDVDDDGDEASGQDAVMVAAKKKKKARDTLDRFLYENPDKKAREYTDYPAVMYHLSKIVDPNMMPKGYVKSEILKLVEETNVKIETEYKAGWEAFEKEKDALYAAYHAADSEYSAAVAARARAQS